MVKQRLVRAALAILLCRFVSGACTPSALPQYACQASPLGGAVVSWRREGTDVSLSLVCPGTGWCALGFKASMVGANPVVGAVTGAVPLVQAVTITERSVSGVNAAPLSTFNWIKGASVEVAAGVTTLAFTYDTGIGTQMPDLVNVPMALAYGSTPLLAYHTNRGVFAINAQEASTSTAAPSMVGDTPQPSAGPESSSPSASPTAAPALDTPSPATPVPSSAGCTASTLPRGDGSQASYMCATAVDTKVSLHWTLSGDEVAFALAFSGSGWFGIGFPETPGTMGPGVVLVAKGQVTQTYQMGSARDITAFTPLATMPHVASVALTSAGGQQVMRWIDSGRQSNRLPAFNVAYHETSAVFRQHDRRYPFASLDLVRGAPVALAGNKDYIMLHGAIMTVAWAYLAPLAILAKRFGPGLGCSRNQNATYPLPFVLHAGLMGITIACTVAMVILALAEFSGDNSRDHKTVGLIVLCLSLLQLVMQVAKPPRSSDYRKYFYYGHAVQGVVCYALAMSQMFTGPRDYNDMHPDSAFGDNLRIVAACGIAFFVTAYLALVWFTRGVQFDNSVGGGRRKSFSELQNMFTDNGQPQGSTLSSYAPPTFTPATTQLTGATPNTTFSLDPHLASTQRQDAPPLRPPPQKPAASPPKPKPVSPILTKKPAPADNPDLDAFKFPATKPAETPPAQDLGAPPDLPDLGGFRFPAHPLPRETATDGATRGGNAAGQPPNFLNNPR